MMKYRRCIPVLLALASLWAAAGWARGPDDLQAMQKRLDAIQVEQKAIRQELEAIRALLVSRQAPTPARQDANVELDLEGAPVQGDAQARLTVVEFFDYECPFCRRHFAQSMPQLMSDYVRTGKIKYVARDFPLEQLHSQAFLAAQAGLCAQEQDKFWPLHDLLMSGSAALQRASLTQQAHTAGLEVDRFDKCVDSNKYAAKVREEMTAGEKAGVGGTPTLFVGVTDETGKRFKSIQTLVGAVPYDEIKGAIDRLLPR
jgi:protein-disulfide isomerase